MIEQLEQRIAELEVKNKELREMLAARGEQDRIQKWAESVMYILGWVLESSDRLPGGVVESIQRLREMAPEEIKHKSVE